MNIYNPVMGSNKADYSWQWKVVKMAVERKIKKERYDDVDCRHWNYLKSVQKKRSGPSFRTGHPI